jgi:hypothetical protein
MMYLVKHFGKAIGVFLLLYGIFWIPKDLEDYSEAAEPWRKAFATLDQNTALWVFAIALSLWIAATDVRRFIEEQRRRILSRPKPETHADKILKERIIEFGKRYYVPATDALNEALRISAYVVKDAWDHPAKLFVFSAFSDSNSYNPEYRRLFDNPVQAARLSRLDLERAAVSALNEFGIRSHKLQHVVSLLQKEGKSIEIHEFDKKLADFWSARKATISVLRDIQSLPGLSDLRVYNVATYIDDKEKWDMTIIESALHARDGAR